uniref:YchJ family metal-binding protein n=1 Tax=Enteractinococcus helveticum TaxID=1837282 RepID=UPI002E1221DC
MAFGHAPGGSFGSKRHRLAPATHSRHRGWRPNRSNRRGRVRRPLPFYRGPRDFLHERSRFTREAGRWVYVDGELF